MFTQRLVSVAVFLVVTGFVAGSIHAQTAEPDAKAAEAFAELINVHREMELVEVKSTLQISLDQAGTPAEGEEIVAMMIREKAGNGRIDINGYTMFLNDGQLYMTHETNEDEFFELTLDQVPYMTIVWEIFQSWDRIPFPHLAIFWGDPPGADLYMELYADTPELVPAGLSDRVVDGQTLRVLEMKGPSGTLELNYDPATFHLASATQEISNSWLLPDGVTRTNEWVFEYSQPKKDEVALTFSEGDRQRVDQVLTLYEEQIVEPQPVDPMEIPQAVGALVGKNAPGFILSTPEGEVIDLGNLRGQVVVIDFWAEWCPPCRKALPELHEVSKWAKKHGLPVTVLTINTFENGNTLEERVEVATKFWKDAGLSLPILMDADDSVAAAYGVTGIPATFVIGTEGKVAAQHTGAGPDYADQLKTNITDALTQDG